MKHVASLRYGVIFKKAFCDPEIFTAFAQDVLGITLEIDHVETEKSFSPSIGRVAARFDLYAEDRKHRTIVDIQHERYGDHYHRFLHYQCAAILEQVVNAEEYRPPLKVFTIVVLTSGDRHQCDVATIEFDPKDRQGRPLREIPHKVIYLCPKYVTDETPAPYREWLRAIADSLDEEVDETQYTRPEIRKIFDYIEKDHVSPEERARMFDEYGQEGLRQEKYAEGLQHGEHRKALDAARKMLAEGFDTAMVTKITGLIAEELATLPAEDAPQNTGKQG